MDRDKTKSSAKTRLEQTGSTDSIVRRMLEHQTDKLFSRTSPKKRSAAALTSSLKSPTGSSPNQSNDLTQSKSVSSAKSGSLIVSSDSVPLSSEVKLPSIKKNESKLIKPAESLTSNKDAVQSTVPSPMSNELTTQSANGKLSLTRKSSERLFGSSPQPTKLSAVPPPTASGQQQSASPQQVVYVVNRPEELVHNSSPIVLRNANNEVIPSVEDFEFDQISTDPSIDQAMLGSMQSIPGQLATPPTRLGRESTASSGASLRVKPMPAKYSLSAESAASDSLALRRFASKEDIDYVRPSEQRLRTAQTTATSADRLRLRRPVDGWGNWATGSRASDGDSLKLKATQSKEDIGQASRSGKGARFQSASLDLSKFSRLSKKMSVSGNRMPLTRPIRTTSPGSTLNEQEVSTMPFYTFDSFSC
jgi:hypothetical protein